MQDVMYSIIFSIPQASLIDPRESQCVGDFEIQAYIPNKEVTMYTSEQEKSAGPRMAVCVTVDMYCEPSGVGYAMCLVIVIEARGLAQTLFV